MTEAITKLAEKADPRIPTTIYYAFKQSEIEQEGLASTGWATFIEAIQKAGFAVVATWPVRTEKPGDRKSVRVGKECVSTCRSGWSRSREKKKTKKKNKE